MQKDTDRTINPHTSQMTIRVASKQTNQNIIRRRTHVRDWR